MTTKSAPITDLELMLYFDGELPEDRRAEVERFLAQSVAAGAPAEGAKSARAAQKKLLGLALVGDLLRSEVDAEPGPVDGKLEADGNGHGAQPPDIAALVMARLDEAPGAGDEAASRPVDDAPPAAPVAERGVPLVAPRAGAPANDNARRIWGLAVVASAAAAALLVWGLSPSDGGPDPGDDVAVVPSFTGDLPEPAPSEATSQPGHLAADAPLIDDPAEQGVEVSSVDFGAKSGSIFYVSAAKGADSAPTTVVWLADGDE